MGGMVFRLRMSYFIIILLVFATGFSSAMQFKSIADRKSDLTDGAIPFLAQAQSLVTLLSAQAEQIVALQYIDPNANLDDFEQSFQQRRGEFEEKIKTYEVLASNSDLRESASRLFGSSETLIDLELRKQQLVRARAQQLERLRVIVDQMEIFIEGLRLDLLTDIQNGIDLGTESARIGQLSLQLNTLISLELRIENMQDTVESGAQNQDRFSSKTMAQDLSFSLRESLRLISRIDASDERVLLARELIAAGVLLSGKGGVLESVDAQVSLQGEIDDVVAASLQHVRRIETLIATTIETANARAETTSALLDQSIRSVSITNLFLLVVVTGGFVLVLLFLIEMQLNRRIKSLITSVRRFADGDYADKIAVTGTDELGEIAHALRLSQKVARDLRRSNADLQSFAYAASHDLKTPLRAITDLAEWTLEDARDELSAENLRRLELLSKRSVRLSDLLDALLLYAQVDGMSAEDAPVDLHEECAAIADLVDPKGHFSVTVTPGSANFSAPLVPFRQILTNLVSNAIKHHDKLSGTIIVRAQSSTNFVELEVQDDGPGIPSEYHSKIFRLFEKLESRDVVEGSGIGLSLVEKLTTRHGGSIRVKSDPNKQRGTTFVARLSSSRTA